MVGAGGGGDSPEFKSTGGGGSGAMTYRANYSTSSNDIQYKLVDGNNSYSNQSLSSLVFDFINAIEARSGSNCRASNNTGGEGGQSSSDIYVGSTYIGGNGGGAPVIDYSVNRNNTEIQYCAGAQGGGVIDAGENVGSGIELTDFDSYRNDVSTSNPNVTDAYDGGSNMMDASFGGSSGGSTIVPTPIPLFALGGTGEGGFTYRYRSTDESTRWNIGGGGAGGYGDGGNGGIVQTTNESSVYNNAADDGGYGAGAGGRAFDRVMSRVGVGGDGGQAILIFRYHD